MGVVLDQAPPGYPEGFPPELVAELEELSGREFLLNRPYNGVAAIEDYGDEHLRTGKLILYTSADSVLQIAAHHDVLSEDELVEMCRRIRGMLRPPHEVGRVIARPFKGEPEAFERTAGRKDFSLVPPARSYLDELHDAGVPVHAVGKVYDLFTGRGIDTKHAGSTNPEALASTTTLVEQLDEGLVFVNLVETDQNYGHRGDLEGFHRALQGIDTAVAGWLDGLRPGDLLILTADHGVDMTTPGSDHTREHAPLLTAGGTVPSARHDGPFADVGATVLHHLTGRKAPALPGTPFL
jgi:phosphopentomutase